ncbi:hypothetical protein SCL_1094 [Sulfuricaulis limicola]|uniref:Uncharacterized protein n=1 Tax=Sulfuricaulis limicola TaxID=1620215 RepID=A0A1B4XF26_9GAMM|nr:hypothetical protein [Sulfuricaulis limicola]BAV33408.1 hypothetical protein SCL_1094 [Sulfuricaulis limicola]
MGKLVIKVTVYQDTDPDLYDSVSHLPLRRRSAVIRRLWRRGLQAGSPETVMTRRADPSRVESAGAEETAMTTDPASGDGGELLRRHLDGLSGLTAFV